MEVILQQHFHEWQFNGYGYFFSVTTTRRNLTQVLMSLKLQEKKLHFFLQLKKNRGFISKAIKKSRLAEIENTAQKQRIEA